MQDNETLFYSLSGTETLTDPDQIERLLQELTQSGYLLVAEEERRAVDLAWMLQLDPPWPHWSATDRAAYRALAAPYLEQIFTAGISEQLQQEIEQFKQHQRDELRFYARAIERTGALYGHEFDLMLAPQRQQLALHYSNDFWTSKRNEPARVEAFDHFLGLVKTLYELYHPIYAYAWNHNHSIPLTASTSLEQRAPSLLYEINLFGPEMVANLQGKEYVLKTPAQFVHAFSDGGVLIIPEAPWYPGSLPFSWSKVAKYLGVTCPDFAIDDDEDDEDDEDE